MKMVFKAMALMLCLSLTFLSGCQRQNEQVYHLYTSEPKNMIKNMDSLEEETAGGSEQWEVDETQGELEIYSSPLYFDWIVQAFNKKYPNVKVTYNFGSNENDNSFSDYTAKTFVDMMSGSAGDVIDIGGMSFQQFGKNNLLEDLYPYIENDSEFHKEDYYSNIFEAMKYDNKLWAIPIGFSYYVIRFNKTMLEENQVKAPEGNSLSYQDIVDVYHKIAPNRDKLLISENGGYQTFERVEYNRYYDEKQGRAYFDSPDFPKFLNEMKKLQWPSKQELKLASVRYFWQDYSDRPGENDLCLITGSFYYKERNAEVFYKHPSNLTTPIPLSASNGDKLFYTPDKTLGVLSSSKNKDLAWKFIRFCIEEKSLETLKNSDTWPLTGMPINRNNTIKLLEDVFREEDEEAVQSIDRWNSEVNERSFIFAAYALYEPIQEIAEEFFAERITAEECARQMQERAEIYLKE